MRLTVKAVRSLARSVCGQFQHCSRVGQRALPQFVFIESAQFGQIAPRRAGIRQGAMADLVQAQFGQCGCQSSRETGRSGHRTEVTEAIISPKHACHARRERLSGQRSDWGLALRGGGFRGKFSRHL
jgi:hypothetical protein